MSVKSLYSDEIQRAWATVFACAWSFHLKDPTNFDCSTEDSDHFHHALVRNPKKALDAASKGKYQCDEFKGPSLQEAAKTIVNSGLVLPFPEPPTIDNLNAEQLRQFFDQDGVMGVLRFT